MTRRTDPSEFVGRETERAEIAKLLASVRRGIAATLVLRGEAGVGKSSLLADAIDQAADFEVVRFVAVESEMHLGFAALHGLLLPFLQGVDELPAPQRKALSAAFGMSSDDAPDPFLVGLAALTLLSTAATRQPLLVVDDAQWLDEESSNVAAFVARRLYADRVGILIAMRETNDVAGPFDDLPLLDVRPLSDDASRDLLAVAAPTPLGAPVTDRIIAEASGNPLALVELVRELSSDQRAGVAALPEPLHIDRRVEERFLRQVRALPDESQRLLLAVAAEPTGDTTLVLRAGEELGFDEGDIDAALAADLLTFGPTVGFRHSVIRSVVYQGASEPDRRRTHAALATATDVDRDPDRRAWHRAAATAVPDEEVAEELDRAAGRAQSHGGHAATAALFERSADLTPDRDRRALRLLQAAVGAQTAGNYAHAYRTVSRAIEDLDDPTLRSQARRVQAAALFFQILPNANAGRVASTRDEEIMATMLDTVREVAPLDIRLAREMMLDVLSMALFFAGRTTTTPRDAGKVTLSLTLPDRIEPTSADLVLDALAALFVHGPRAAVPALRTCMAVLLADAELRESPRTMALGCWVGLSLGDDDAVRTIARDLVEISREKGALQVLPEALNYLGQCELRSGALTAADAYFAEQREIGALSGRKVVAEVSRLLVAAWRGRDPEVRSVGNELSKHLSEHNIGLMLGWVEYAHLVLELGQGNYVEAARRIPGDLTNDLGLGPFIAAAEIEAHVRGGDADVARARLAWLSDRALANQSPLELGLLARGKALLADDGDTEPLYQQSAALLSASGADLHLAQTQLLYGEWLRRQSRRREARSQLEPALVAFESAGADGFAERTRAELLATGARARRRVEESRDDLTPQEEQIARLASGGATNAEIAGRLFISPNTVDYHLRKVFRKLSITSRRQLAQTFTR